MAASLLLLLLLPLLLFLLPLPQIFLFEALVLAIQVGATDIAMKIMQHDVDVTAKTLVQDSFA